MSSLSEIRKNRIKKLEAIKKAGINPYPATTRRQMTVAQALTLAAKNDSHQMILAGRLRGQRGHGGSCFADLHDDSAKIQLYLKRDVLGKKDYRFYLANFDIGDFVEAAGVLFKTKAGEITLEVREIRMLAKSLRPLPEKWHGLKDDEVRLRRRYLDILFNSQVRQIFEKKAVFWNSMREFLLNRGFLEVETPVLEIVTGGADARPFITHHNALDIDVYLRISMGELWQKRLMVAGFEKTFEIGRQFRNEGMDAEHLQDYTQMEFYWAYADYQAGMKLVEEMYKYAAQKTFNTLKFKMGKFEIDLDKKWEKYDYIKLLQKETGVNVLKSDLKTIEKKLKELKIDYDQKGFNLNQAIDNLWKYCRRHLGGPGFLTNIPVVMEPLAKRDEKNPEVVQRFQVILAGSEMGKGYSELNDPIDQAERFSQQQKLREAGDEEAQMYDKDFVEALEYGMPPCCGFGVSERLFSFLMNKSSRECQIFPLMRPKKSSESKNQSKNLELRKTQKCHSEQSKAK